MTLTDVLLAPSCQSNPDGNYAHAENSSLIQSGVPTTIVNPKILNVVCGLRRPTASRVG